MLNKVDLYKRGHPDANFEEMKGYYRNRGFENIVFFFSSTRENMDQFKKTLFEEVKKKHLTLYPNYVQQDSPSPEWESTEVGS